MRTVVCLSACLLLSSTLHAEETASEKAAADALFNDGRKLMKAGSFDEACPKFAESYRLSERAGTLLNLATCHEKQGKTASAWAEYNEVAALAKKQKRKDRETYARTQAKELEPKLSRVTFKIPASVTGAVLKLDGKEISASVWGSPLPVDPGKHVVDVSAPSRQAYSKNVDIEGNGAVSTIEIPELKAESAPAGAVSTVEKPEEKPTKSSDDKDAVRGGGSSTNKTIGWIAVGVGVVGVGVGGYFGLRTFSKKKDADDHCGSAIGEKDANACDAQGVDLRNDAKHAGTFSTIGFAVGAVGIGTGLILILTSSSNHERANARAYVSPAVGPRSLGVTLGARL